MEILAGLEALPDPRTRPCIATWGVFDGVHRGHRKVLDLLVGWARADGVPSAIITFDRHPAEVLRGQSVPLICPLAERLRLLGEADVDFCLVLTFTAEFARTPAETFIRDVVGGRLGARGVVLGHDSRFGRDRTGDLGLLESISREGGLDVRRCGPDDHEGRPVSSSLVREAVFAGRLEEAQRLLGRPPSVFGTVVRGERRGTALGFPTANLALHHAVKPPPGVYAGEVLLEGRPWTAVVNLGTRPTFTAAGAETVEAHLPDWTGGDLYGRVLELRFLRRLREERRFPSAEDLRRQISEDVALARAR